MAKFKVTPQIEATGYGLSGDIGGLPKTTYYTPDGRVIRTIVNFHTNTAGQVRDANLDKGWLLSRPAVLKLFCKGCDRWHDTTLEVKACVDRQKRFIQGMNRQAERERKTEDKERIAVLEKQIAELRAKVEGNGHGQVLQSEVNEPTQVPRLSRAKRQSGR